MAAVDPYRPGPKGRRVWDVVDALLFFGFWQSAQRRLARWTERRQLLLFAGFAVVGVISRFWASTGLRNFDFDSYLLVSDAALHHQNPYETGRYNYGPVWLIVLSVLRSAFESPTAFRIAIATVLILADLGIAFILMRRGFLLGAGLLLLSPVSVAISGQHQQFDNVAILFALLAVQFVPKDPAQALGRRDWAVVLLLGLSLTTKHVFIVFPLWLALQQRSRLRAAMYLLLPPLVLVISLVPFWILNAQAVWENVIGYRSYNNMPILSFFLPASLFEAISDRGLAMPLFLAALVALGFLYRSLPAFESALVYSVSTVVFASALARQYFAIPMAAASAFMNIGFLSWFGSTSIYLGGDEESLGISGLTDMYSSVTPNGSVLVPFLSLLAGWGLMSVYLLRRHRRLRAADQTRETVALEGP